MMSRLAESFVGACLLALAGAGSLYGDDTARLQALLDSGKGRVEFPDGTFVVSKPLVVRGPDVEIRDFVVR